ncbi:MAG: Holliday junction branch migration protein RuvA [Bacteroidetes bacterium]|jgi:Holliday junction DNA helicase RuvA|nr:Holliday junction branch migration protein RuvA [Bacteroidota bacterium]
MIASIRGLLISKAPTELTIEVNGIGYVIHIPLSTYEKVGDQGSIVSLFTHLHVREDALQLYGFATEAERNLFKLLISVSGIGPKIAQSILSGISVDELHTNIVQGNVQALTTVQGIGRKTAERIVLELRDALSKTEGISQAVPSLSKTSAEIRNEALLALISLGFTQQSAEKAIRIALHEIEKSGNMSVEELIKEALRHSSLR